MMQPARPVYRYIESVVQLNSPSDGGASVGLTEAVQAVKDGAILADVEALQGADLVLLGFGRDGPEEGYVVVGVETTEVAVARRIRAKHMHLVEEAVAAEQRVGHADPMRLHRVALAVVVVPHLWVVEITNFTLPSVHTDRRERIPTRLHGGRERGRELASERGKGPVFQVLDFGFFFLVWYVSSENENIGGLSCKFG
jgi:hypothetical protein